jgi:hypothetical protein
MCQGVISVSGILKFPNQAKPQITHNSNMIYTHANSELTHKAQWMWCVPSILTITITAFF